MLDGASLMTEVYSDILIFMKVGRYGFESITSILPRIKALYEAERSEHPNTFYPFGYRGEYTPESLRNLMSRHLAQNKAQASHIDVIFSPTQKAYTIWRQACKRNSFPKEFDLGPKEGAWRHMDLPVRGSETFPERYPTCWESNSTYYALLIEDLEIYDSPSEEVWIDLRQYRRMVEGDINGWELRGRWRQRSSIPCFKVDTPASEPRYPESVIAKAKLVEPYAVQLQPEPFLD